jgi:hypothetical protein
METCARERAESAKQSVANVQSDYELRIPYYCEENCWRLLHRRTSSVSSRFYVVFISNAQKTVPVFRQRASEDPLKPCYWDYHVILVEISADNNDSVPARVYDIDSRCRYPCPLPEYLQQSFPFVLPPHFKPYFRVVDGALYLEHFSSDRSHMFNESTQTWNAPPPSYRCIQSGPSNLDRYLDFSAEHDDALVYGRLFTLDQIANLEFDTGTSDAERLYGR